MLNKPEYGWCTVEYNDKYLGDASYITDVAGDSLRACLDYLTGKTDTFKITYDNEGHYFGLITIDDEVFGWIGKGSVPEVIKLTDEYIPVEDFVRSLSYELIEDINTNFEDWCHFDVMSAEPVESEEYQEDYNYNKEELTSLIEELELRLAKPSILREMELGNILWGNSRGKYPVPRDEWQDKFCEFLEECGFDSYGHIEDDKLEAYIETKVSSLANKDIYSEESTLVKENPEYRPHLHYFDNGVFMLNPYYWGDADDLAEMCNFKYYPTNYELCWYKYPLRDAWANKELTFDDFCDLIDKCRESL